MNVKHMKRAIGAAVACVALAAGVVAGSNKATVSQSAKTPAREVPRFEADASWAKIPNGCVFRRPEKRGSAHRPSNAPRR